MLVTGEHFQPPKKLANSNVENSFVVGTNQRVTEMRDSSQLLKDKDRQKLWDRFYLDRYLLFREAISVEAIVGARSSVLRSLECIDYLQLDGTRSKKGSKGLTIEIETGNIIQGTNAFIDAPTKKTHKEVLDFKTSLLKDHLMTDEVKAILNHRVVSRVLSLLSKGMEQEYSDNLRVQSYLMQPTASWLRVKCPGETSYCHSDLFYFKRDTGMFPIVSDANETSQPRKKKKSEQPSCIKDSETLPQILQCCDCEGFIEDKDAISTYNTEPYCSNCVDRPIFCNFWVPLQHIDVDQSVLAVLLDSHNLDDYYDTEPGEDFPKTFRTQGDCMTWATANFQAGDLVFFDSSLIHCASDNMSEELRLSLDFRSFLAPIRKNWGETHQSKFIIENSKPLY